MQYEQLSRESNVSRLQELILKGKGNLEQRAEHCLALLASSARYDSLAQHLSCFSALQQLCITCAPSLTDNDLAVLKTSRLHALQLQDCPCITGVFVQHLCGSIGKSLRRLLCRNCPGVLDGPVCGGLRDLELNELSFAGSVSLTDEVVAVLTGGMAPAPLPHVSSSLSYLDLSQTSISDQGALALGRLKLTCLALSRTRVSQGSLKELSRRLSLKLNLLPHRPKVLLRSFAAAVALDGEVLPAWSSLVPAALDPQASQAAFGAQSEALTSWPEPALRHAAALLFFQAAAGRKRPAASLGVAEGKRRKRKRREARCRSELIAAAWPF